MRKRGLRITVTLGVSLTVAVIAREIATPLAFIAAMGVFDRLFGADLSRRFPKMETAR